MRQVASVPDGISVFAGSGDSELVRIPLGESARRRYGAPYWVIHRADLQAALLARVRERANIELRLGAPFEAVDIRRDGVAVSYRQNGMRQTESADLLIGADGVWSDVRSKHFNAAAPDFSGTIAWRATIDAARVPEGLDKNFVTLWLGSDAHVVMYPLRRGTLFNIVAMTSGRPTRPGWNEPGDAHEIATVFDRAVWPPALRGIIGAAQGWKRYALFTADGRNWTKGPIALLGDAAHAMLPFAAQGAAMAIEDAAVLATCLSTAPDTAAALQRYAELRQPRVARVRRAAWQSGLIFHLRGPFAAARNLSMQALGGARLLSRQDWIYEWSPPESPKTAGDQ